MAQDKAVAEKVSAEKENRLKALDLALAQIEK